MDGLDMQSMGGARLTSLARIPLGLCAVVCLAAGGCGRIGYDEFVVVGADPDDAGGARDGDDENVLDASAYDAAEPSSDGLENEGGTFDAPSLFDGPADPSDAIASDDGSSGGDGPISLPDAGGDATNDTSAHDALMIVDGAFVCSAGSCICRTGQNCLIACSGNTCGNVICEPGARCNVDCRSGDCHNVICQAGATCSVDCTDAQCSDQLICQAGSTCSFDCTGGACSQILCDNNARCDLACAGGTCDTNCNTGALCRCLTGNASECQSICGGAPALCTN